MLGRELKLVQTDCARCSASDRNSGLMQEAQNEMLRSASCNLTVWQSGQVFLMALLRVRLMTQL